MYNSLRGFYNPPTEVTNSLRKGNQKIKFAKMKNSGELKFILCPICEQIVYSDNKYKMYEIDGANHTHPKGEITNV